jgi:hypothetical protein
VGFYPFRGPDASFTLRQSYHVTAGDGGTDTPVGTSEPDAVSNRGMPFMRLLATAFLLSQAALCADENVQNTIKDLYTATFAALRQAQTKDDIAKMVTAIDAPEWIGNGPNGETMTRADAISQLEPMLAVPSEKRPAPKMDFVYMRETGWNVLVVYWVYDESASQIVGSLARDPWVRTTEGWRRIRHEKFFLNRPLVVDGKAVILPPHD